MKEQHASHFNEFAAYVRGLVPPKLLVELDRLDQARVLFLLIFFLWGFRV